MTEPIRVYNTLTRTKETFRADGRRTGPHLHVRRDAVRGSPHRQRRPALVWSIIRKYLLARGIACPSCKISLTSTTKLLIAPTEKAKNRCDSRTGTAPRT